MALDKERVSLHCEIDGLVAELDLRELSGAGAFVVTTQPLPVDSEVSIFVRLGEQRFEMTGHVVQSVSCEQATRAGKLPGYALLFTNLPDQERRRLSNAIQVARGSSLPPRASPAPKAVAHGATPSRNAPKPSAKPAAPSYDPAELALLGQLKQELSQIAEKTAWATLGVSQGADPAQLKAAFFQASKRYHPHLFARYAHPEIKRIVTELFIAHKRAFTTMTKLKKKHA